MDKTPRRLRVLFLLTTLISALAMSSACGDKSKPDNDEASDSETVTPYWQRPLRLHSFQFGKAKLNIRVPEFFKLDQRGADDVRFAAWRHKGDPIKFIGEPTVWLRSDYAPDQEAAIKSANSHIGYDASLYAPGTKQLPDKVYVASHIADENNQAAVNVFYPNIGLGGMLCKIDSRPQDADKQQMIKLAELFRTICTSIVQSP